MKAQLSSLFTLPLDEQFKLSTLLSQPHRTYHNINHINDLLTEMTRWFKASPLNQMSKVYGGTTIHQILSYMIWYHDAVYNPYPPYHGWNEEQSADLFLKVHHFKDTEFNFVDIVHAGILATAKHTTTQTFDLPDSEDLIEVMLDLDLSGLGKPFRIFGTNSLAIRNEYPVTSDMDFLRGRRQFFFNLLDRGDIFYTEYFRDLYENSARKNMHDELTIIGDALDSHNPHYYFAEMNYLIKRS